MSEEFIKAIRDGLFINTTQDELSANRIYEVAENIAPYVLNSAKKELMEDAYDAYVSYIRDNSEAVVHLNNTSITISSHFPKRDLEEGDKLKVIVIKED